MRPPAAKPWYREPWAWFVISLPLVAVVGGLTTVWIAYANEDSLVADDYYKQGLAINQVLDREREAARLGISARILLKPGLLQVDLKGAGPPALFVRLAHATRAGYDMRLRLEPAAPGIYEASLPALPPGHWRVLIDDPRGEWRIARETR